MDLSKTSLVDSSLRNAIKLLKTLYFNIRIKREKKKSQVRKKHHDDADRSVEDRKDRDGKEGQVSKEVDSSNEEDNEDELTSGIEEAGTVACASCELTVCEGVELVLEFLQPLVGSVRDWYVESGGGEWHWTDRQTICNDM